MDSLNDPTGTLVRIAADPKNSPAEQHRAFGALVARFQDFAFGCAYALLGNAALAEEAAQEAFITAWRHLGQLREADAFPGWLRRIVVTRCHRIAPRVTTTLSLEDALTVPAPECDRPPEQLLRAERAAQVHAAIAELPEQERLTIILFYIGDHTRPEIAGFLGISPVAVKKRLAAARGRLKERLLHLMQEDLQEVRPSNSGAFAARVLAFTKLFSALIDSGISLVAALDRLAEQEADSDFRAAIIQIRTDLFNGSRLSSPMRKYPQYFSEAYIAVIEEGEVAGQLEVSLNQLANAALCVPRTAQGAPTSSEHGIAERPTLERAQ